MAGAGSAVELNRIVPGRGKGGSVRLAEAETLPLPSSTSKAPRDVLSEITKERSLYGPLKEAIQGKWIKRFGFDEVQIEETHSRGSKNTGGVFTRPDITAVGIRRYVHLSKRLEVVTFEVKPTETIGVMGVLEAIAHREAAHRAYVVYAISRTAFDGEIESERIIELAQKYGIGILVAERPNDVESWDIVLDAVRHEPDPAPLDRFLGDLSSDGMKKQLSKWKE